MNHPNDISSNHLPILSNLTREESQLQVRTLEKLNSDLSSGSSQKRSTKPSLKTLSARTPLKNVIQTPRKITPQGNHARSIVDQDLDDENKNEKEGLHFGVGSVLKRKNLRLSHVLGNAGLQTPFEKYDVLSQPGVETGVGSASTSTSYSSLSSLSAPIFLTNSPTEDSNSSTSQQIEDVFRSPPKNTITFDMSSPIASPRVSLSDIPDPI